MDCCGRHAVVRVKAPRTYADSPDAKYGELPLTSQGDIGPRHEHSSSVSNVVHAIGSLCIFPSCPPYKHHSHAIYHFRKREAWQPLCQFFKPARDIITSNTTYQPHAVAKSDDESFYQERRASLSTHHPLRPSRGETTEYHSAKAVVPVLTSSECGTLSALFLV